jgi:hypothetical protein
MGGSGFVSVFESYILNGLGEEAKRAFLGIIDYLMQTFLT